MLSGCACHGKPASRGLLRGLAERVMSHYLMLCGPSGCDAFDVCLFCCGCTSHQTANIGTWSMS